MNKALALKVVNCILFLSVSIQVLTILVFLLELKLGDPRIIGLTHKYNGLVLVAMLATHITLNWSWIKATYFKKSA